MSVKVNLAPLRRFQDDIRRGLAGGSGPIRDAIRVWAAMYRAFVQERFKRASRGGGEWTGLKEATIKARQRRNKAGRRRGARAAGASRAAILWQTGTLVGALQPRFGGVVGQLQEDVPFGIRVGYGRDAHPGTDGRVTVQDLATWHQTGAGNLPARPIIVDPDRRTVDMMRREMEDAIRRSLRANGIRD